MPEFLKDVGKDFKYFIATLRREGRLIFIKFTLFPLVITIGGYLAFYLKMLDVQVLAKFITVFILVSLWLNFYLLRKARILEEPKLSLVHEGMPGRIRVEANSAVPIEGVKVFLKKITCDSQTYFVDIPIHFEHTNHGELVTLNPKAPQYIVAGSAKIEGGMAHFSTPSADYFPFSQECTFELEVSGHTSPGAIHRFTFVSKGDFGDGVFQLIFSRKD